MEIFTIETEPHTGGSVSIGPLCTKKSVQINDNPVSNRITLKSRDLLVVEAVNISLEK